MLLAYFSHALQEPKWNSLQLLRTHFAGQRSRLTLPIWMGCMGCYGMGLSSTLAKVESGNGCLPTMPETIRASLAKRQPIWCHPE